MAKTGPAARDRIVHLVASELDRIYRMAGLILRDQQEAQDATQDALLRAWRSGGSLRDPEDFPAWFDRIVVNACLDRLRRRAKVRIVPISETASPSTLQDPFRAVLDRDAALRMISVLDDHERALIILHYWADLTLEGVADRLGWPLGTVKSRLHKALSKMRANADLATLNEVSH